MKAEYPESFCIKFDFQKGKSSPDRVFRTILEFISALDGFDEYLIDSIEFSGRSSFVLENVESGSIKAIVRRIISIPNDKVLQDLEVKKIIGSYLVAGRSAALKFLSDNEDIRDPEKLDGLENKIAEEAGLAGLPELSVKAKQSRPALLEHMSCLSNALANTEKGDHVSFISRNETIDLSSVSGVSLEEVQEILSAKIYQGESEVVLQVKKADFLGSSKWEFRKNEKPFYANIEDQEWLNKFHTHRELVRPGDSIRGRVHSKVVFDERGGVLSESHIITKVDEVIEGNYDFYQTDIL